MVHAKLEETEGGNPLLHRIYERIQANRELIFPPMPQDAAVITRDQVAVTKQRRCAEMVPGAADSPQGCHRAQAGEG